ncbi:MAG: protein kinase domain-containing protein [Myxococcota bacterium]
MLPLKPESMGLPSEDPSLNPTVLVARSLLGALASHQPSGDTQHTALPESTLMMSPEDVRSSLEGLHAPEVTHRVQVESLSGLEPIPAPPDDETCFGLKSDAAQASACADDRASAPVDCEYDATLFPGSSDAQACQNQTVHAVLAGRYKLLSLIGVGGMGSVYRARDRVLDEVVALKILRPDKIKAPGILERFKQEVRLSRRITHRNVARMYDIGEEGDTHFLTMEFVQGVTLAKLMAYVKPSPLQHVLEMAIDLCEGLQAAHDAGVVHRDLKPDNILIQKNPNRVVITDFGIAWPVKKPSEGGTQAISGTPTYMAPEQVEDRPLDGRADLFALGVILFEALTGAPPWQEKDVMTLLVNRLSVPAPPLERLRPDLPAELCRLVNSMLSREPEGRPTSARMVQQSLRLCHLHPLLMPEQVVPMELAAERVSPSRQLALAILPFQNLSGPEDAHLAEGLMEDIYDGLSGLEGIHLVPRYKTRALAGFQGDLRTLKTSLGVDSVLEGTVRRQGTRVRLTARLSCTEDGIQLWSRRFDRGMEELLMLGDEAAHELAAAMTTQKNEERRVTPTHPEAIELYLKGRQEYNKSWGESNARALDYLARAYQLAPEEPLIMASYAMALSRRFIPNAAVMVNAATARRLAEQVLQRAPHLGEAHMALGWLALNEGDAPTAAMRVRRALKLSPGLPDTYDLAGRLLVEVGAHAEGLRHLRTALALDPTIGHVQVQILRVEGLLGHFEIAEQLLRTLPNQPETFNKVIIQWPRVLLWNHRPDLVRPFMEGIGNRPELPMSQHMRLVIEAIHDVSLAPHVIDVLWSIFRNAQHNPRFMTFILQLCAEISGYAGQHEQAFEALLEANRLQHLDLLWLERCPQLAGVRQHPGYPALHAAYQQRAELTYQQLQEPAPHLTAASL